MRVPKSHLPIWVFLTMQLARELDRLVRDLPAALDKLVLQMEKDNDQLPADLAVFFGSERRLVDTVQKLIVPDMLARLS
jgi:hypothetical protein